jgi:zinc protease
MMAKAPRLVVVACALAVLSGSTLAAQEVNWPSERPPRPLPARDVKFPPYQFRTLPNGLQVIAVSHHEQPAVSLRLILRVGGSQDPADKSGLAMLAASLLDQGTTTRDAEKIASSIDSIGGATGTGSGSDLTFVNAVVMKDSFDLALDLVSDLATNPAFAPEEIDRQKQQMLSGLKVSYEDPDYIAGVVFDRLVYGYHPYGRPDTGTPQSISGITRDDLVKFHKTWFGANNAILAIVGDIQPEEAFAGAERAFGKWGRAQSAEVKVTEPPAPTRRVVVVDRPGAVQTEIRVGNVALPRKHPDFLALDLALKILGGEGGNRLHRVLRSERGLTYGASADVYALKDAGDLMADTDTRSDTTAEALRLVVDEMWKLQRQKVSSRELADAQAYLTGSFPLTIETPSAIALQVLNAVFYGLDLSELQTFRERVNAVTPEDIQRVAQQYLRPDRLSIVLVGDASVFTKQLPGAGFDQFDRIGPGELDLGSANLKRSAIPASRREPIARRLVVPGIDGEVRPVHYTVAESRSALRASAQDSGTTGGDTRGGSVRALTGAAVQAKGGIDKLRSVKTVKAVSTTWIDGPGGRVELPTTTYIRYPDAFRVDAVTPSGPVSQWFVEGAYWVRDARGVREAPAALAAEMHGAIQRDAIKLLVRLAEAPPALKRSSARLGGRDMPALEMSNPGGAPVTIIFDPVTALIAGQRYTLESPDGPVAAEEVFSDYRDVDGLKVAHRTVLQRQRAPRVERIVTSFEYNIPLDPALFARPL